MAGGEQQQPAAQQQPAPAPAAAAEQPRLTAEQMALEAWNDMRRYTSFSKMKGYTRQKKLGSGTAGYVFSLVYTGKSAEAWRHPSYAQKVGRTRKILRSGKSHKSKKHHNDAADVDMDKKIRIRDRSRKNAMGEEIWGLRVTLKRLFLADVKETNKFGYYSRWETVNLTHLWAFYDRYPDVECLYALYDGSVDDLMKSTGITHHCLSPPKRAPSWIADMAADVLTAVAWLHEHLIIHGDIKGDNVLWKVDSNGRIHFFVHDVGLMRLMKYKGNYQKGWCSTPGYMPPEVNRREGWDEKVDLFMVGELIQEALGIVRLDCQGDGLNLDESERKNLNYGVPDPQRLFRAEQPRKWTREQRPSDYVELNTAEKWYRRQKYIKCSPCFTDSMREALDEAPTLRPTAVDFRRRFLDEWAKLTEWPPRQALEDARTEAKTGTRKGKETAQPPQTVSPGTQRPPQDGEGYGDAEEKREAERLRAERKAGIRRGAVEGGDYDAAAVAMEAATYDEYLAGPYASGGDQGYYDTPFTSVATYDSNYAPSSVGYATAGPSGTLPVRTATHHHHHHHTSQQQPQYHDPAAPFSGMSQYYGGTITEEPDEYADSNVGSPVKAPPSHSGASQGKMPAGSGSQSDKGKAPAHATSAAPKTQSGSQRGDGKAPADATTAAPKTDAEPGKRRASSSSSSSSSPPSPTTTSPRPTMPGGGGGGDQQHHHADRGGARHVPATAAEPDPPSSTTTHHREPHQSRREGRHEGDGGRHHREGRHEGDGRHHREGRREGDGGRDHHRRHRHHRSRDRGGEEQPSSSGAAAEASSSNIIDREAAATTRTRRKDSDREQKRASRPVESSSSKRPADEGNKKTSGGIAVGLLKVLSGRPAEPSSSSARERKGRDKDRDKDKDVPPSSGRRKGTR